MSAYTAEQLAGIANLLQLTKLCPAADVIVQPGKEDKWYAEFRYIHHYPVWSDGDLLLAILNRCAELGYRIRLDKAGYSPGIVQWRFDLEAYSCSGVGPRVLSELESNPLEAVILAAIQLPEAQP